jgi:hypothetical protein
MKTMKTCKRKGKGKAKMARTNPYNLRGMIPIDSDMFFGREREMRRIEDMLSSDTPQCVSFIGERRIGKSSLVLRVYHKMKASQRTIAVYLDCDGLSERCNSKDEFFKLLNQLFLEALEEKPGIKDLVEKGFNTYSSFKAFIKNCGQKGIKTIIFIDEFEHLPKKKFADDTFFSNLRATANNPGNRLAFVTISKKELENLAHKAILSSHFWNIFENEIIGLLDHKRIEALRRKGFKKAPFLLTDEEIGKIHFYAGDFPFFNQVVCSFIWDTKRNNSPLNWNGLEVKLRPHFKKIWNDRQDAEQKLLKDLKGVNSKEEFVLNDLLARGLAIKKEKGYVPFSEYFSKLIKALFEFKKKRLMDKEIIKDLEKGLDLIKKGREAVKVE